MTQPFIKTLESSFCWNITCIILYFQTLKLLLIFVMTSDQDPSAQLIENIQSLSIKEKEVWFMYLLTLLHSNITENKNLYSTCSSNFNYKVMICVGKNLKFLFCLFNWNWTVFRLFIITQYFLVLRLLFY